METKTEFKGYCDLSTLPIKPGDYVRVPKGTLAHSTAAGEVKITKRAQVVKVHHILPGMDSHRSYHGETSPAFNPRVVWAGSGGYWMEADINDVENVEDPKNV